MKVSAPEDILLSSLAQAIGEPAKSRILLSQLVGRARTSTELAVLAGVAPSIASAHLNRLRNTKFIRVAVQGRHRYYSLYSSEVARVIESLGALSGRSTKKFIPSTPEPLRTARSCYDHMAGAVAVALHDCFLGEGWLVCNEEIGPGSYQLSPAGRQRLERLGIEILKAPGARRRFAFACLDWSERRPHIAGSLGATILQHALNKKWVVREFNSRALRVTKAGAKHFSKYFGITV